MLRIGAFSGEVPRTHPRLLADGAAQVARNTRLENGALVPIRKSRLETSVSATAVTIYRHLGNWLTWDYVVNAVPGPVANERLYTTGGSYPQMLVDGTWYKLAIPRPDTALSTNIIVDSEFLSVDGKEIRLSPGVRGTTTHGWKYVVTRGDASGSAVVTISYPDGASGARTAQLINGIKYRNASSSLTTGVRTVSLSSVVPVSGDEIELECLDSFVDVGVTGDTTTHCTPDDYGSASATLTVGDGQVDAPSWANLHIGNSRFSDTINDITVDAVSLIAAPVPCSVYESVNDQYIKNYDGLAAAINAHTSGFKAAVQNVDAVKSLRVYAPDASGASHDGDGLIVTWDSTSGFPETVDTFGGGATGSTLTSLTVDGVELLATAIDYVDFASAADIAAEIAAQVNASSTTPSYTAEASGAAVTIYSDDSLMDATGREVAVISGIAITISGPLAGDTAVAVELTHLDPDFSLGGSAVSVFSGAAVIGDVSKIRVTVVGLANGDIDSALSSTVVYSYTWVTEFDEESEPAELSAGLLWSPGNRVRLAGFGTPPASRAVDRVRLYRSQTSALGETSLYFIAEVMLTSLGVSWYDDPDENEIQEVCPSVDYNPPPDGLRGLIALPNGMMAAFKGRDLYFSEPWIPHAWPEKYILSTNVDIVGLGAFGSSVAVLTEGTPYVVQGTSPDAMTMERLEVDLPCTSYRAIVDLGYTVAYPSHDGLVAISSSGAQLVSQNLFTREQWQTLHPDAMLASRHAGRYVLSYYTGSTEEARDVILVDLSGAQPFVIRGTANMRSQYYDAPTGQLFYVTPEDPPTSNDVMEWDCLTEDRETQTWRSKQFVLPAHTNFGALLIEAEPDTGETASVKVYADGALKATITALNTPARLPSGFLARQWELEVTGTAPVTGLTLAISPSEIAGAT